MARCVKFYGMEIICSKCGSQKISISGKDGAIYLTRCFACGKTSEMILKKYRDISSSLGNIPGITPEIYKTKAY